MAFFKKIFLVRVPFCRELNFSTRINNKISKPDIRIFLNKSKCPVGHVFRQNIGLVEKCPK